MRIDRDRAGVQTRPTSDTKEMTVAVRIVYIILPLRPSSACTAALICGGRPSQLGRASPTCSRLPRSHPRPGRKSAAGVIRSRRRQSSRSWCQPFALPTSASTARRIASGSVGQVSATRWRSGSMGVASVCARRSATPGSPSSEVLACNGLGPRMFRLLTGSLPGPPRAPAVRPDGAWSNVAAATRRCRVPPRRGRVRRRPAPPRCRQR